MSWDIFWVWAKTTSWSAVWGSGGGVNLKKRIPQAIGLIRTGDTTQYGNIVLESA